MDVLNQVLTGINNLTKSGIPIKTDNKVQLESSTLVVLASSIIIGAAVLGLTISAGRKIFS